MEVGSDGVAGKTLEESFERVSAKAVFEPFSELLQIFSKLIIGSNSIGVFEDKTKGVGINFPYEESEIIYYKSQNMDYERLDFYNDSCFDELLLKLWSEL